MLNYLYKNYPDLYEKFICNLKKVDEEVIKGIVFKVPDNFMTEEQKKLVVKILLQRKRWMINFYKKEGD